MLSVNAAIQKILRNVEPLSPVRLPLIHSLGHVLSDDVFAPEPIPFFTNSAMDGYAVSSDDIAPLPRALKIVEEVPAGKFPEERIRSGTCARIMTGAPLPQGADAVVPLEHTEFHSEGYVRILSRAPRGQCVRQRGEEISEGDKIFPKGRLLKPADLGLLASMGAKMVSVYPKPSASLITTGSEIVHPASQPKAGQIRNSNLISITAALTEMGLQVRNSKHVKDRLRDIKSALLKCSSNVLLTCGGVSVGEYDFVKSAIAECGKLIFWKVAMKPGKPFVFGKIGRSWVFGLPGNPVSALVTLEVLVKPALLALAGKKNLAPATENAVLHGSIRHLSDRQEYIRAHVRRTKFGAKITPLSWQGSGMLRSLTEANAWIIAPQKVRKYADGSSVRYIARD